MATENRARKTATVGIEAILALAWPVLITVVLILFNQPLRNVPDSAEDKRMRQQGYFLAEKGHQAVGTIVKAVAVQLARGSTQAFHRADSLTHTASQRLISDVRRARGARERRVPRGLGPGVDGLVATTGPGGPRACDGGRTHRSALGYPGLQVESAQWR